MTFPQEYNRTQDGGSWTDSRLKQTTFQPEHRLLSASTVEGRMLPPQKNDLNPGGISADLDLQRQ